MAWEAPRRGADPLARAWGRPFVGVDELDLHKPANLSTTRPDDHAADMGKLLSPIDEEDACGMSSHAPLAVHLTVRFNDPAVRSVHTHSFYSSRSFCPTDRICRGLIRRIDHGSEELLTRKDPYALKTIQCLRQGPKPWRFEMTFKIAVHGHSGTWATRIFISYQKQPLNRISAQQVLRSAHSIVGLFLQRHDNGFHWREGPLDSYFPDIPGDSKLACIPVAASVPGYTLKLVLRQSNTTRAVRMDSAQAAPLTLALGQDLMWQAYKCVEDELTHSKNNHDRQHYEKDALRLELDVVNNLGPAHDDLRQRIHSELGLSAQEVDVLADTIRHRFQMLTSQTDLEMEKLHDFDFSIAELIGDSWHEKNCARLVVNDHQTLMRRDVEALLDRIRTGLGDVLKEHNLAVRMVAHKRGHLVLDKVLVARDRHLAGPIPPDRLRVLIDQLKERIQKDVDMVCKDTCSLDDVAEVAPLFVPSRPPMASYQTPPGSPASFRTRPSSPLPSRMSSPRAFPLFPAKYKTPDTASIGSRSQEDVAFPGLKPAAEVYPAGTRNTDFDVESNSTHSSMPTLAESDTPSPDQSMLITPSGVRSYLSSFDEPGLPRFSKETSASSRTSYSEVHQWAESKEPTLPVVSLPSSGAEDGSGTSTTACPPLDVAGPERESFEHDLPIEGWLLHYEESEDEDSQTPTERHASATPEIDLDTHDSGPAQIPESVERTVSDTKSSQSEPDAQEAVNSASCDSEKCPMGVSEMSDQDSHVTSRPGSDVGSEALHVDGAELAGNVASDWNEDAQSDPSSVRPSPVVTEDAAEASETDQPLLSPVPKPGARNRHSWSSSEWEDVSDGRQSRDSVNTISPCVSQEAPESPKRLRTPTAGLLGLSESRWADFGIRSALTGTHAFDPHRPSTAPMVVENSGGQEMELREEEEARPSSPRKMGTAHHHHHLRHKKSIGSVLFVGGAKSNQTKKGEDKTGRKKSAAAPVAKEGVEDSGRFPRAMMLVAGLAFASSVVSRNNI